MLPAQTRQGRSHKSQPNSRETGKAHRKCFREKIGGKRSGSKDDLTGAVPEDEVILPISPGQMPLSYGEKSCTMISQTVFQNLVAYDELLAGSARTTVPTAHSAHSAQTVAHQECYGTMGESF